MSNPMQRHELWPAKYLDVLDRHLDAARREIEALDGRDWHHYHSSECLSLTITRPNPYREPLRLVKG